MRGFSRKCLNKNNWCYYKLRFNSNDPTIVSDIRIIDTITYLINSEFSFEGFLTSLYPGINIRSAVTKEIELSTKYRLE